MLSVTGTQGTYKREGIKMIGRETSDNVGQVRADLSKQCWNCGDPIPSTRDVCDNCEKRMREEEHDA